MRQKPALDLVFKKTPKSFSVKPAHQEDEVKFDTMLKEWSKIDYKKLEEEDDETSDKTLLEWLNYHKIALEFCPS